METLRDMGLEDRTVTRPGGIGLSPQTTMNPDEIEAVNGGRPLVIRNATVLTMDSGGVRVQCDVLVIGERIEAVGTALAVPNGTVEIDAAGGILMPGMVDTHRHMWQTALRGLGPDWTLTQYFSFHYLTWGKIFRPQDIAAGNLLSGIEAVDGGVTTTVDWSHGLPVTTHAGVWGATNDDSIRLMWDGGFMTPSVT